MKATRTELQPAIIKRMFGSDEELLTKYHIEAGRGINRIVSRTVSDLKNTTHPSFQFFLVTEGEDEIGFFGTEYNVIDGVEVNYLTSIFAYPRFRTREYMGNFWKVITDQFDKPFFSGLHERNTRAINFYKRNGATVLGRLVHGDDAIVVFRFGE